MLDMNNLDMNNNDMMNALDVPAMPPPSGGLNAPEKAAVIIGLLGSDYAAPLVEKIEDRHLRRFVEALGGLKDISREVMLGAVAEFITALNHKTEGFQGGKRAVESVMESLFSPERVAQLFGSGPSDNEPSSVAEVWAEMKRKKSGELTDFLSQQRAEVVSVILGQLTPIESGEILSELPEDLSVACVRQMARGVTPNAQTIEAIAEFVRTEFLETDMSDPTREAALFVSDVLGVLPRDRRETMLDILTKNDPENAQRIRDAMLTFEDLPVRLPSSAIPILFKDMDAKKLQAALKAGETQSPGTIEYLYANISQRMAGQFKEDVAELSPPSGKQADKAISNLMVFIGQLEKQGRIKLISPEGSDEG